MRLRAVSLAISLGLATPSAASDVESSVRPQPRAVVSGSGAQAIEQVVGAVKASPRPLSRPENLKRKATVRAFLPVPQPKATVRSKGSLCGVKGLTGQSIATTPARVSGCGLTDGVRVTAVADIRLSPSALMDCATAQALAQWVKSGLKPAVGRRGGGVAEIKVAAHYICRTRNNKPGGKVSEHGRGKAIDISGITLKNGTRIKVLTGWRDPAQGKILKSMHKSACGPFGTVLGPNANRHHKDHFHFDTARHGNGAYCR